MKKILALMLILISPPVFSFSQKFEVTCWHNDDVIFHRYASDVYMGPGFITAVCKNATYTLAADCLISYDTKKSIKH